MARFLSRKDVENVLSMNDAIYIIEKAFTDLANGRALMPLRTPIQVPQHNGLALFMPAYLAGMGALGTKVVTVYRDNLVKYDLPTVLGTILLFDEKNGVPLAIMEAGFLTAMRTGAVSGLATRLLARDNARVHTMFGTGGMARAHAWAVACVRHVEKLILYSIDSLEIRQIFRDSLAEILDAEIVLAEDPHAAVEEADIVTLITNAKDPIVKGDWFSPGTHINCAGAHDPEMREIDSKTVVRSKVICDLLETCKVEVGDFIIPIREGEWSWDRVHGSLGDVVIGEVKGRENDEEITLFKSVGLAIQDISTAFQVYQKAIEKNVGIDFEF